MLFLSRASKASCVAAAFFLFLRNRIFFCQNYSGGLTCFDYDVLVVVVIWIMSEHSSNFTNDINTVR